LKEKEIYTCSACGAQSLQWRGQCSRCHEWNTLQASKTRPGRKGAGFGTAARAGSAAPLQDVRVESYETASTGLAPLDRLLGQGLTPGGAVLLGGAPGIGKSTLLLQMAGSLANRGLTSVYLSGEESLPQLKDRATRLGALAPSLLAMATSNVEDGLAELERRRVDLLIVDSVQTLVSPRAEGLPGSVSQVRAVATELIEAAKRTSTPLLLVGHITKDGQIAGPMLLEHMVDTVLSMEGERQHLFRILRVLKNRFGPCQEMLVFQMGGQGMELVDDPSTIFLGERNPDLSGAAVVMTVDGRRPFAVEVQALVSRSYLSFPRRTSVGFDVNRLHLLLAVLEKRLRLNLGQFDIYAKLGGGLRMQDPGLDLGLVSAVLSSFYDEPLPERAVCWGEVDLNGQIRPVSSHDVRATQAERLGYGPIVCPRVGKSKLGVDTLASLQQLFFGSRAQAPRQDNGGSSAPPEPTDS
jgi:DNA repair protein RadA/Sms